MKRVEEIETGLDNVRNVDIWKQAGTGKIPQREEVDMGYTCAKAG